MPESKDKDSGVDLLERVALFALWLVGMFCSLIALIIVVWGAALEIVK